MLTLLSVFVGLSIEGLTEQDKWKDFHTVIVPTMEGWPFNNTSGYSTFHFHVKNFFLYASEKIFQNMNIIPFIASISLLILTYFFVVEISKKRFSGLISVAILLQSSTFLEFGSSPTYANFWTLFYLLSLYLIIKKWQFSSLSYVASIFSKPLTIFFFPLTLFFTYRSEISRKQKIFTAISYGFVVVIGIIAIFILGIDPMNMSSIDFSNFDKFLYGFTAFGYQLRFDLFIIIFLVPLIFGLFMLSKKGKKICRCYFVFNYGHFTFCTLNWFDG